MCMQDSRRAAAIRLQQVETEAAVAEAELERLKAEVPFPVPPPLRCCPSYMMYTLPD